MLQKLHNQFYVVECSVVRLEHNLSPQCSVQYTQRAHIMHAEEEAESLLLQPANYADRMSHPVTSKPYSMFMKFGSP